MTKSMYFAWKNYVSAHQHCRNLRIAGFTLSGLFVRHSDRPVTAVVDNVYCLYC